MEKIIKILVDSEKDAFQISQELSALDHDGTLSIANSFILSKDRDGLVSLKDAKGDRIATYTLGGVLTGSLLGILGGPLGILWGATLGLMAGTAGDIWEGERKSDYLDHVGKSLPNGKTALLVHLDEHWTVPLDTICQKYGATLSRYEVDEEIESYIQRELNSIDQGIQQVSEDISQSTEENKALLNQKLQELKEKRQLLWKRIQEKTGAQKKQYQKWLDKIQLKFHDLKDDIQDEVEDFKEDIAEEIEEIKDELKISRKKRLEKQITHHEEKLAKLAKKLNESR